ncbi:hypothetical protein LY76DRAFT_651142 [Colletotrichum caudatum]|nr:hypothetical protein LY76DRAFT_651142 [Colletotrichum caudatum]
MVTILRLDIAYNLIRKPKHLRASTGLQDLAKLAAISREWRSLVTPLLYTEAVLADYVFYAAGGDLANVKCFLLPEKDGILMSAAINVHLDLLQRLLDHAPLASPTFNINRLLSTERDDIIRWILNQEGMPLHMAILWGDGRASKLLMVGGAVWDRPFTFSRGVTALHLMAANNAVETIDWLASDPEARRLRRDRRLANDWPDDSGRSSFQYACHAEQASKDNTAASRLIQALLSLGALVATDDMEEVSRRLEAETQHLRHGMVLGQHSGDSDWAWASRLERGGAEIKKLWTSRVCPVEYAARRKNYCMATAMAYATTRFP